MAILGHLKNQRITASLRLVVAILLALMCTFKLFLSYKGLNQPEVMDQAQIARSVANGEGFVTKFYKPFELAKADALNGALPLDLGNFRDVNHAPLNIVSMAAALKLTGKSNFDANRIPMDENGDPVQNIYDSDRIISAVSCLYFLLAMVLAYALIARMFDETVAAATICCFAVSELMLDYAISGLPQPLMLCCLLTGLHFLLSANNAMRDGNYVGMPLYLGLSFVAMTLMCLSGWLSVWLVIGYLVFCSFYFRPYGMYGLIGLIILLIGCSYSMWMNYKTVGSVFGNAFYGIYDCFGGSTEGLLRSVTSQDSGIDTSMLVVKFIGAVFSQIKSLYVNCGSVLVAPFFCLALFFRYKRSGVQCLKWALLSMWAFSCIGMALYGTNVPLSCGQLAILFAPLFVAYGFSLMFNFMARLNSRHITFSQLRGVSVVGIVLLTAGATIATFPSDLYRGVWLREKGAPHYPPYYPPAMNCKLYDITNPYDVIVTDQPWGLAWYGNRRAVWIPRTIEAYQKIKDDILSSSGVSVQGILITPSSYDPIIPSSYAPTNNLNGGRPGGFTAVDENMGQFTPLALNLPLAILDPRGSLFVNNFAPSQDAQTTDKLKLGDVVSISNNGTSAHFDELVPLNAGAAVYYRKRSFQQTR